MYNRKEKWRGIDGKAQKRKNFINSTKQKKYFPVM